LGQWVRFNDRPFILRRIAVNVGEVIKQLEKKYIRTDLPKFDVGDTIKMRVKVIEADKARLHPFEGIVIRKSGTGLGTSFVVRKISFGEGVERTFPLHSPIIESINVVAKGKTNRAKLYYLRGRQGKRARVKKEMQPVTTSTPPAATA
jgi:large subunit ribosomal protein L19